jgi:hypothetical protein
MIAEVQRKTTLRVAAMVLLLTSGALFEATRMPSLVSAGSADIWGHLRVGTWILQNHSIPHSGVFSQSADLPWNDASWGFDALLASGFRGLGMRSIPALQMGSKTALAIVAFLLAGGLRGRFWAAVTLSALAQLVIAEIPLSPAFLSILLFGVELLLLMEFRRTGNVRLLFWLPVLFLVWANLDAQFVLGIGLLFLLAATAWVERLQSQESPKPWSSYRAMVAAMALAVVVTFLTPNFYRSYQVFFAGVTSSTNRYLPGFPAMTFKQPQDYLLLLLTMAAFLSLGMRRSRDPFRILLLIGCTLLSFHSQRDAWMVALGAVAIIGEAGRVEEGPRSVNDIVSRRARAMAVALVTAAVLIAALWRVPDNSALIAKVSEHYPVAASDYIRSHQLEQPLFNAYEWGGFLMWYLPQYPVSIDSRSSLYEDDFVIRYSKVMNAELPFTADPRFLQARTILLPRDSVMGEALSSMASFKVVYADRVAVVLVKHSESGARTEVSRGKHDTSAGEFEERAHD